MKCVYLDLDGTLLGKGGSLLHDRDGKFTLLGVRALEACFRAGVEVVLFSGRRKAQVAEDARLIGATSYIYEVGAGLVIDGEEEFLTGDFQPGELSIHDQITAQGGPQLLLETFQGRLEYHAPWHLNREISHIFRGLVDLNEVDQLFRRNGINNLRLIDNGTVHRRSPQLQDLPQIKVYHLIPAAVSKANSVLRHRQIRGYDIHECIAIGDSREDMETGRCVKTFWFVANALERDPTLKAELGRYPNIKVASEANGAGVYEAVVSTLAQRD